MSAYYNENDAYAAQWLRNLIAAGHIAPGEVDERSIVDVRTDDLRGYRQCHFFAGVGVWSYALRLAGWPDDEPVWTGSCPCQPFSSAGARQGDKDERHLWPTWFGLIRESRPDACFGEQVADGDGEAWLDHVGYDLEGIGYALGAVSPAACGFGAPHERQRLFFVAEPECQRLRSSGRGTPQSATLGMQGAEWQRQRLRSDSEPGGEVVACELADPEQRGREGRGQRRSEPTASESAADSESRSDMGDADAERRDGQRLHVRRRGSLQDSAEAPGAGPTNGFWRNAEWVWCSDGFWRPHGPQSFPLALAHELAARVGRVRAYGNAIVAEVAAEFIRAYIETRASL